MSFDSKFNLYIYLAILTALLMVVCIFIQLIIIKRILGLDRETMIENDDKSGLTLTKNQTQQEVVLLDIGGVENNLEQDDTENETIQTKEPTLEIKNYLKFKKGTLNYKNFKVIDDVSESTTFKLLGKTMPSEYKKNNENIGSGADKIDENSSSISNNSSPEMIQQIKDENFINDIPSQHSEVVEIQDIHIKDQPSNEIVDKAVKLKTSVDGLLLADKKTADIDSSIQNVEQVLLGNEDKQSKFKEITYFNVSYIEVPPTKELESLHSNSNQKINFNGAVDLNQSDMMLDVKKSENMINHELSYLEPEKIIENDADQKHDEIQIEVNKIAEKIAGQMQVESVFNIKKAEIKINLEQDKSNIGKIVATTTDDAISAPMLSFSQSNILTDQQLENLDVEPKNKIEAIINKKEDAFESNVKRVESVFDHVLNNSSFEEISQSTLVEIQDQPVLRVEKLEFTVHQQQNDLDDEPENKNDKTVDQKEDNSESDIKKTESVFNEVLDDFVSEETKNTALYTIQDQPIFSVEELELTAHFKQNDLESESKKIAEKIADQIQDDSGLESIRAFLESANTQQPPSKNTLQDLQNEEDLSHLIIQPIPIEIKQRKFKGGKPLIKSAEHPFNILDKNIQNELELIEKEEPFIGSNSLLNIRQNRTVNYEDTKSKYFDKFSHNNDIISVKSITVNENAENMVAETKDPSNIITHLDVNQESYFEKILDTYQKLSDMYK